MERSSLDAMKLGWFVGNFDPSVLKTSEFEVAVKKYRAGDTEAWHYHKVATEITLIVSGKAEMCGEVLGPGAIIKLAPGEGTDFRVIEDTVTVVVKTPCVLGDKYTER